MPEQTKPTMKWTEGAYSFSYLKLAGGFISATVGYASGSRTDPKGYEWTCNNFKSARGHLYPSPDAAKVAVEKFIERKMLEVAGEVGR